MRHQPRTLSLLLCLVALEACGGDGPSEPAMPTATGTWILTVPGFEPGPDMPSATFILKESSTGRITGSGSYRFPDEPLRAFTVRRGTHTHPDVHLELSSSDPYRIEFSGRMSASGDEIEGGLGIVPVLLVRQ